VSAAELDVAVGLLHVESASGRSRTTEHALVERARTDPEAFGCLFEVYYPRVLGFTYRCTWNRAVAEDLTSATFFKALRAIHRYDQRAKFSAWLYRIATNEVRMHWRSQARKRAAQTGATDQVDRDGVYLQRCALEAEESVQARMRLFAQLREAVTTLPDRYRTVIMLRYFEGLSCDMVAEVLNRRVGTVKSLIHRGVGRLRKILEQDATFCELWNLIP
jgi:RNA polymerase sigma-70 factor, ECF subfamily